MTEPVRRAAEIEEPSNLYVIHPLSSWLVPHFARWGVTPNMVSLLGMGCGIAAGFAYHDYPNRWCVLLGFLLMIAWHVCDGADGQLARLTLNYSEFGKIVDGICDYVTFTAVYIGLTLTLAADHGDWIWWLALLAGLCHAMQAAAYELQRQFYNVYGLGRASAALPDVTAPAARAAAGWLHLAYTRAQLLIAGNAAAFHASLAGYLRLHPERGEAARARYRAVFAPVLRRWSVLSSNARTIGIFLFALAGAPILYFVLEIVMFSALLAALLLAQERRYARFAATLM